MEEMAGAEWKILSTESKMLLASPSSVEALDELLKQAPAFVVVCFVFSDGIHDQHPYHFVLL